MLDVIIVGGGPAGLSAALILGRARRRVVLCDTGRPRNAASRWVGGYLGHDGTPPHELRRIGREQLATYDGVSLRDGEAVDAARGSDGCFQVGLADGSRLVARKLLLATGVIDDLPPLEGAEALYGRGVHHCPYCDGWELRDQPLAVYGQGAEAKATALELSGWTRDLVVCSDGPAQLEPKDRARLDRLGIRVDERPILRLEAEDGHLARIRFRSGEALERRGLFFFSCGRQASDLALRLGCELTDRGSVETGRYEKTQVPGLWVAGDASRNVQLAIIAAAEGAMAAFAINGELLKEDLAQRERQADRTGEDDALAAE